MPIFDDDPRAQVYAEWAFWQQPKSGHTVLFPPLAQPVCPIFEDEKSNGSDEKSVKQKIAKIATELI